jgi:hypothetical protein
VVFHVLRLLFLDVIAVKPRVDDSVGIQHCQAGKMALAP